MHSWNTHNDHEPLIHDLVDRFSEDVPRLEVFSQPLSYQMQPNRWLSTVLTTTHNLANNTVNEVYSNEVYSDGVQLACACLKSHQEMSLQAFTAGLNCDVQGNTTQL